MTTTGRERGAAIRPVVEWVAQNGIDEFYPDTAEIVIDLEARTIKIEKFIHDPHTGQVWIHGRDTVMTQHVTYPLLVEPPAGLLETYEENRRAVIAERGALAGVRQERTLEIIDYLERAGMIHVAALLRSLYVVRPAHRLGDRRE